MRPFDYLAPQSVEDAVAALAENSPDARALAGGTDLLVDLKHETASAGLLVDLTRIAECRGIEESADGLRFGSLATHTEIMESELVRKYAPSMIDAARTVGAVQTRNLGTLGGNLVTCVPSLDSGPVLVALDAQVTIAGIGGRRRMPLTEFFVGPRKTALEKGEILVDIIIPRANLGKPCSFRKFGLRKGQALALVNVAAAARVLDGRIAGARIALGAVAPTVIRAREAEALLDGEAPDPTLIAKAAEIAVTEAKPIDDFRASAAYRCELIRALTGRVLNEAIEQAAR
ncbi:MAG: xanthine dehydrogenase family protein subunit M [Alphaproteobacteria bacterium]|nr:xanthine dehydrogenase family protein subunit M [Alphaproteobacteria bacterium]